MTGAGSAPKVVCAGDALALGEKNAGLVAGVQAISHEHGPYQGRSQPGENREMGHS